MAALTGSNAPKVAIVGAGLTGLLTAHGLRKVCQGSQSCACFQLIVRLEWL